MEAANGEVTQVTQLENGTARIHTQVGPHAFHVAPEGTVKGDGDRLSVIISERVCRGGILTPLTRWVSG